ncbi:polysaccharide deacetylase [Micromonospora sp. RP3T]|uniref:polysaccharide deacetylase family protein n=1 Tax=Micromonospora sp. RP3T TaxID=2135446 RepID=UPI0018ECBE88|nr:polysaccharide deacetylase [Micromonospora sp. RP3T]
MTDDSGTPAQGTPPWRWPLGGVTAEVDRVRAGRRAAPWPGHARVAVALSFDVDHETPWLREGQLWPGLLSAGEYGSRRGLPRILDLLDRLAVPATFFVPAVAASLHPGDVRAVVAGGHEIAAHGWIHERPELLDRDEEAHLLARSLDELERLSGTRPVGQRTPSLGTSRHTLHVARDAGLRYDSSLMADDDPYELLLDGVPSGLAEIPVDWARDDAAFLVMDRHAALRPVPDPGALGTAWRREYQAARAERGLFQLTLHPDLIGRRGPLAVLAALLDHICQDDAVWFATHRDLAAHTLTAGGPR